MKYQYNFGFIEEWMQKNKDIPKGLILQALGTQASNGTKKWFEKRYPMPVMSILRFCNAFNVPLSAFFRDADANDKPTIIPCPQINDQLEPDGGFADNNQSRGRGERTILNPLDVSVTPSIVPNMQYLTMEKKMPADKTPNAPVSNENIKQIIDMAENYRNSLAQIENDHQAHVNRLLDIIVEQQKQIADLTTRLSEQTPSDTQYQVVTKYVPIEEERYSRVAEDNEDIYKK